MVSYCWPRLIPAQSVKLPTCCNHKVTQFTVPFIMAIFCWPAQPPDQSVQLPSYSSTFSSLCAWPQGGYNFMQFRTVAELNASTYLRRLPTLKCFTDNSDTNKKRCENFYYKPKFFSQIENYFQIGNLKSARCTWSTQFERRILACNKNFHTFSYLCEYCQ
jgi:hypothetical protein